MAQALVRHLAAQKTEIDGIILPLFAGMWAIFGHGNVAGIGEALSQARDQLPTYRAHNEQAMAHAAIAFAKASNRRRMMACTTSIGPGATNMITAAAVAHVNRLPVLLLPGDVFAHRRPDPVLQQVEDFNDGTVSANDCFRPVSSTSTASRGPTNHECLATRGCRSHRSGRVASSCWRCAKTYRRKLAAILGVSSRPAFGSCGARNPIR
jgi:TPP-dependent trihydroxycyclohexane-1,2-dione (THcHDO) dehydratase